VSWFDALVQVVGRAIEWRWFGRAGERADLTAVDLVLRTSIAFAVFVVALWLIGRFG
jgi:hypothetical protein